VLATASGRKNAGGAGFRRAPAGATAGFAAPLGDQSSGGVFLRWRQVRQAPRGHWGEYRRRRGLPGDPSGRGAGSNADFAGPFQGFDSTCG
jgi:hypothetical protein